MATAAAGPPVVAAAVPIGVVLLRHPTGPAELPLPTAARPTAAAPTAVVAAPVGAIAATASYGNHMAV